LDAAWWGFLNVLGLEREDRKASHRRKARDV